MSSELVVQFIIGGFGLAGIVSAGVALFKLRPEVNSMAVTDAQGASAEWQKLYAMKDTELTTTEQERDSWRERALEAEDQLRRGGGRGERR